MIQKFASGDFSFSISHSKEYSGLISFRIDWFDLFTVQGTLKSPSITVIMIVMDWMGGWMNGMMWEWDIWVVNE